MFQSTENNKTHGIKGEELTVQFLVKKGHAIIDRNWRFGHLEIDIISENQGFIVFTEVKLRHTPEPIDPAFLVNKKKQRNIVKAANAWLQSKDEKREARFDVVTIFMVNNKAVIEHFEDAFYSKM